MAPQSEIQADVFLAKNPTFDGRGVVVAIFDTVPWRPRARHTASLADLRGAQGCDPAAPGLTVHHPLASWSDLALLTTARGHAR